VLDCDTVRWNVPLPMVPPEQLLPLARAVDECGYDSIAVPESVFFPEVVSADYPYTVDGQRFWAPETPFLDPFVAVPAMAAVTERVGFVTNVVKVPLRNPLLLAKQVASIAALAEGRFTLGVGLSWMPEEFAFTGTDMRTRGIRTDEAIDVVRAVCGGGGPRWVSYEGRHTRFDRLMISPAPQQAVPIWVGGHSEPALRRAARLGDGWISVNTTEAECVAAIARLAELRAEAGRGDEPFEVLALCIDVWDADGWHRLEEAGVTEVQVLPWYLYGGDPEDLDVRLAALARFADEVVARY
jgi:probable F420-dependent oxidoreductase